MPFDWRDYLAVADEFATDPREAIQRSSISRAYYCIYHLGMKYARSQSFQSTNPGLHSKLWGWYQRHPEIDKKKLGVLGSRLKESRLDADYRDQIDRLPEVLKRSLKQTHEFIQELPQSDCSDGSEHSNSA